MPVFPKVDYSTSNYSLSPEDLSKIGVTHLMDIKQNLPPSLSEYLRTQQESTVPEFNQKLQQTIDTTYTRLLTESDT